VAGENRKTVKEEAETEEVKYTYPFQRVSLRSLPYHAIKTKEKKKAQPKETPPPYQSPTVTVQRHPKIRIPFPFFHHDIIATLTKKKKTAGVVVSK
jgi:hypothetical protein